MSRKLRTGGLAWTVRVGSGSTDRRGQPRLHRKRRLDPQTATTIASYSATYKPPVLYFYIAHGGPYTNKGNEIFNWIPRFRAGGAGGGMRDEVGGDPTSYDVPDDRAQKSGSAGSPA